MRKRQGVSVGWTMVVLGLLSAPAYAHKAHVHGAGTVSIAIENGSTAQIDLDFPGDTILGFEHPAKTASDRATEGKAFSKLKTEAARIVRFDAGLGCAVTAEKVGYEQEEGESSSEHRDVSALYSVTCRKPLAGSKVSIGLFQLFPRAKRIKVRVLRDNGQTEREVSNDGETLAL